MFRAFKAGRRNQMWLTFRKSFGDIFWLPIFKICFSKNMICERKFRKKSGIWTEDIFLFRSGEAAKKFRKAQKLNWSENLHEKNRLLGESLGYPKFAIDDFEFLAKQQKELLDGKPTPGDRICVKCFAWGYDAMVCRPENYEKLKDWLKSQQIPLSKCVFSSNESGK